MGLSGLRFSERALKPRRAHAPPLTVSADRLRDLSTKTSCSVTRLVSWSLTAVCASGAFGGGLTEMTVGTAQTHWLRVRHSVPLACCFSVCFSPV